MFVNVYVVNCAPQNLKSIIYFGVSFSWREYSAVYLIMDVNEVLALLNESDDEIICSGSDDDFLLSESDCSNEDCSEVCILHY